LRYVSGIVQASFFGSFGLFDNLTKPVAQHVGDYQIVQQAFGVMVDEVGSPSLGARALTSALMKACLVLMIRQTLEHGEQGSSIVGALSDRRLGRSIAAVLDRPADPHTVQTMADVAMMSRASFYRAFADAFGITPKQFVAKTRLHHAAQMLRATPLPIKLISANVGFSSRSHFSRVFSEAYGVDPSEFRAQTRSRPTDPPKAAH
jgi:transcriptional regulator GlxA family with amidase domain